MSKPGGQQPPTQHTETREPASGSGSAYWVLTAALVTLGLSALAGGVGLVADPTGAGVGLPDGLLVGSRFRDYMVPGVTLITLLGLAPLVVVYALWAGRYWARLGAGVVGLTLLVWIAVQIAVVGYQAWPPWQVFYLALAGLILALALHPALRDRVPMAQP